MDGSHKGWFIIIARFSSFFANFANYEFIYKVKVQTREQGMESFWRHQEKC